MIRILSKKILRRYFIAGTFIMALILLGISFVVVYIHFTTVPGNNIIIYLDLYQNRSVLGSIYNLYEFIFLGFILVLVNYFISRELGSKNVFLSHIMAGGTLALSVLILIAVNGIIHIN